MENGIRKLNPQLWVKVIDIITIFITLIMATIYISIIIYEQAPLFLILIIIFIALIMLEISILSEKLYVSDDFIEISIIKFGIPYKRYKTTISYKNILFFGSISSRQGNRLVIAYITKEQNVLSKPIDLDSDYYRNLYNLNKSYYKNGYNDKHLPEYEFREISSAIGYYLDDIKYLGNHIKSINPDLIMDFSGFS